MYPYAGSVLHRMISKWSHMFYQLMVSDDPDLFEAIHALLNAHVDPPLVVNQCREVIIINDLLWNDFQRNAHELRV